MDLKQLRSFLCLTEELHFGRAAERLGMSQPPLSQQIRALEDELGVRLFERSSRRVQITEAGRLFEPEARRTLAQADHARMVARMALHGQRGRLRISFTSSGPYVARLSETLHDYRRHYPEVELTVRELGTFDQVEMLRREDIDIGMVRAATAPTLPAGLCTRCLVEEEMMVAVRADHPLATQINPPSLLECAEHPLVITTAAGASSYYEDVFARTRAAGVPLRIASEAAGLATLLGLVAAGFGATLLPRSLMRLRVDNVVYRPLSEPVMTRLWIIHPEHPRPTAQAFLDILLGRLPGDASPELQVPAG
ncbi:LysR substrate-binding domain-containing protein [Novosphingobium sp.]|jgi:DNA-binding transcriptional LysR family regulator|uniref:LysR substrate-binding domain-containing protein n=1 Tax=Novosphingobium sp. TaxID=1874826 RepID=UPI0031E19906